LHQVLVCKSLSKVLALSGARVAYLCGSPHQLEPLRAITPPWVVSLLAQVAAVRALEQRSYYESRYHDTAQLRGELALGLAQLGWHVVPGCANFLLGRLPDTGPDAASVVRACQSQGLFLRNAAGMGSAPGDRWIRVAVKEPEPQRRMLGILRSLPAIPAPPASEGHRSLLPRRREEPLVLH
jgi:histidinol-phosphate/aromatic aminotransferase/cobyric acid decarboxylase-like protein